MQHKRYGWNIVATYIGEESTEISTVPCAALSGGGGGEVKWRVWVNKYVKLWYYLVYTFVVRLK